MSQNSILTIQIHWPRFKIALHNPETFLYFPAALVCLYDPGDVLIEIRAYRIKTVVFFFIIDDGLIDITGSNICRFPIFCRMVSLYKSFGIVLLFLSRRSISVLQVFLRVLSGLPVHGADNCGILWSTRRSVSVQ